MSDSSAGIPTPEGDPNTKYKNAIEALEENLTHLDHEDPDKHIIGASLPVASDDEIGPVGDVGAAGSSPNPARADHSHAIKAPFCIAGIPGALVIPNGGLTYYVNTWVDSATPGSENWIGAGPQTIDFSRRGIYILGFYIEIVSDVGGGLGPGYLRIGIKFGGVVSYIFDMRNIAAGDTVYFNDTTHFHSSGGTDYAEFFVINDLPVDVRINRLQFVGSYMSTAE